MEKAATAPREIKRKRSRLPGNKMTPLMAIIIVLLFIYFLLVAYPLFWMICNSLKSYKEIYKNIWAMPKSPLWNNYALAWQRGISKYFLNSVLVTGSTIVGAILVSALASYSLARFRFRGNQLIFILCMGGMMLSPQVTLIPLYKIIQALHIHNTYLALIIPYTAYRIPLIVMLIRSHFLSIAAVLPGGGGTPRRVHLDGGVFPDHPADEQADPLDMHHPDGVLCMERVPLRHHLH